MCFFVPRDDFYKRLLYYLIWRRARRNFSVLEKLWVQHVTPAQSAHNPTLVSGFQRDKYLVKSGLTGWAILGLLRFP